MIWKVYFHKSDDDWRNKIFTVKKIDNFEDARAFTVMKIGNHMGPVKLIHPKDK